VGLLCQRVLIIHRGRLVSDGPPDELRARASAQGNASIEIEARGEPEAAAAVVRGVAGVGAVEVIDARDGLVRLRASAVAGTDPREGIAGALGAARINLRAMTMSTATLEDVFMHLVTREDTP
jgi:ABC-2 type transport system ATP-binding protein